MKIFKVIPKISISNGDSKSNLPLACVAFMKASRMVKSSLRKAIGRNYPTEAQFTTFTSESEEIINSRPLEYNDDDINLTNAMALMHFLSLNPKIGTASPIEDLSYNDPDYLPKKGTSDEELLQI